MQTKELCAESPENNKKRERFSMTKKIDDRYLDTRLSFEERARVLVSNMTVREKISQMLNASPPIPRLKIPAHNWWNECLHGVARAGRATVFPQAIGMAASFDDALMFKVASAISDEARAKHHEAVARGNRGIYFGLSFWSPNINIFRDPRWGRGQETYGEDPHLTEMMGAAFVKGLQGNDRKYLKLIATAKHYAVHSGPESLRHVFDAKVGMRDLRETYLRAFKKLVKDAKVEAVMGAYNRTNGEPCCASKTLLQKILREEWGFDGHVVSDCWALNDFHSTHKVTPGPEETCAMALKNGCDIECGSLYQSILGAYERGLVCEGDIDRALIRIFKSRFKLGIFDPQDKVPHSKISPSVVNSQKHRSLARRMAQESIVLLKNNGILPLDRNSVKNLAVIGPNAMNPMAMLGNYNGFSPKVTTTLEGILGKVSPGTQVAYHPGCELKGEKPCRMKPDGNIEVVPIKDMDAIIAVLGYTAELEGEEGCIEGDGDRSSYGLPGQQEKLLEILGQTGRPLIVLVNAGSPVDLSWAEKNADAILIAWYPGEEGGNAVADVIFGDYNPAGRLPITFVKSYSQLPDFSDYSMSGRTYRFMQEEPLYRFGFGLSYTSFKYSEIKLAKTKICPGENVIVSAQVQNAGKIQGEEVVQLYVSCLDAKVPVPKQHLEAFKRISLKPGENKRVEFKLGAEQMLAYDDDGNPFVPEGKYRISVGGGQPCDKKIPSVTCSLLVKSQ